MLKVLIIDDTKSVHTFVKALLNKSPGISASDAFNGQEAVDLLNAGNKFDLILLDWEMPILTGPETMVAFKNINLETPIIMMTTKNAPEDIQKMFDMGVSEYLMKPFTDDILFEKMGAVLRREFKYVA